MAITRPTESVLEALADQPIDKLSIDTIRTLSMDAVQRANSGHPGTPMALAPAAYLLWTRFLKHNPRDPGWFDRDRFVLSCGHASMLLYSMLHLTGYDLSLTELVNFRQLGSLTPGHPENDLTPGVETTTGPLGQGLANAVGMAMAEAHLAAVFNRPDHAIIDHHTYVFASDGDLMEGVSHEAASFAGHHRLGKLVVLYDDNKITIDGGTELAYSDDPRRRFEGYGWEVIELGDRANDLEAIAEALESARRQQERPTLIVLRTHIGFGAPTKQDTADAHGAPLGVDEVRGAKRAYGWPEEAQFLVPPQVREHMNASAAGEVAESRWRGQLERYRRAHPKLAAELEAAIEGDTPADWDSAIPVFTAEDGPIATRAASGKVLNAFAHRLPRLVGGSADLTGSTKTFVAGAPVFHPETRGGRNVYWGVREHGMCGACNGIALHGGLRPYAATFLIFTDYARPSIRLASLMHLPVIYVMTHDSIGLGEDGPTHQPIEHLASLRAMPNLHVIRPADANETAFAWRAAIERTAGPNMLVLTRQKLPVLSGEGSSHPSGVLRGAYVLAKEEGEERPDLLLLASGSEVHLALDAGRVLSAEGVRVRVVSMPCWELFRAQSRAYRDAVIPPEVSARLAIEAGVAQGWREWIGDRGDILGMTRYGASAPSSALFRRFGFHTENVVERARALL